MQALEIPAVNYPDYHRALRTSGVVDTTVDVLDLDGNHVAEVTAQLQHGQVLVDRRGEVNRALRLRFDDPAGSIDFDPDSPNPTSLYFAHMLRVSCSVYVPEVADTVAAVPFTGPLAAFQRDEESVYVEAHSKEVLARVPAWQPTTLLKGTPKDEAIRALLGAAGETMFALPDLSTQVLRRTISVDRFGDLWAMAQAIAGSMDLQLRYRGDGYLDARPLPLVPVWTFATADATDSPDEADVIGTPKVRRSRHGLANTIEVLGPMPRAGQQRIRGVAVADGHQSSPDALTRGGVPGHVPRRVVLHQLRSNADAQAVAERILEDALIAGVSPRFDALPIYHLDEGDVAVLQTQDAAVMFRLDRFAIPLGTRTGGRMSVGYHRKTDRP